MSLLAAITATSSSTTAPDISIGHLLLQMVVAMVLVVGGIWGFGKIMGRSRAAGKNAGRAAGGFFRARAGRRAGEEGLTVLSRQPLGKGKYLAVVQVGAQQFLVGIAESGLTPLGELRAGDPQPSPDEEPLPIAAHLAAPDVAPAFSAADLASFELQSLGVGPLDLAADLDAARCQVGDTRLVSSHRSRAHSTAAPGAPARTASPPSRGGAVATLPPAGRPAAAPTRRPAPTGVPAPARQQPARSVRSLVESLREATVRR